MELTFGASKLVYENGIIRLYGSNQNLAMNFLKRSFKDKKLDLDFRAITYQSEKDSKVTILIVGESLERLLEQMGIERPKPLKTKILEGMTQRKSIEARIMVFCVKTRRFLLRVNSDKNPNPGWYGMFGGPLRNKEPIEAAIRGALEEGALQIDPASITSLSLYESQRRKVSTFLLVVTGEVEPILNKKIVSSSIWIPYGATKDFDLMPEVKFLFEKDPKVKKLLEAPSEAGYDFSQIVDEIFKD